MSAVMRMLLPWILYLISFAIFVAEKNFLGPTIWSRKVICVGQTRFWNTFFFYFSYFILILLFPFCNFISFHFWRGINLICSAQGQTAYMVYTYVSTNVGMSEHILVYKYIFIKLIMRVSGSFVYTIFSFSSVHLSPHAVKSGN